MRQALHLHPDSRCGAAIQISVQIARSRTGRLELHYLTTGNISELRLPPPAAPSRGDELWQHTCFEVFVRAAPGPAYYEFNFAPSMQWAAYRFDDYRQGISVVSDMEAPRFESLVDGQSCRLQASLELGVLPDLPGNADWHLGVSAVLEETNGRKSYWALAHPSEKPDFHHSEGFVHKIAPTR